MTKERGGGGWSKGYYAKKLYFLQWNGLKDESGDSEMAKVDNNEVDFDIVHEQSHDEKTHEIINIVTEANTKTLTGCNYSRQLMEHENKIKSLKEVLILPLYSKILINDKPCNFFRNFGKLELFHNFHGVIAPLGRRRFRPVFQTQTK